MTNWAEKRRSKRMRSLLTGRVIFNNRCSVLDCTVSDISETGARISFAHPVEIPPEFELDIPKRRSVDQARVMWSRGAEHGIQFIDDPRTADISTPVADVPPDLAAQDIQKILDEARQRIADVAQVPVAAVSLTFKIDAAG